MSDEEYQIKFSVNDAKGKCLITIDEIVTHDYDKGNHWILDIEGRGAHHETFIGAMAAFITYSLGRKA